MKYRKYGLLVSVLAMTLSAVASARDITRDEMPALEAECERQREVHIAPLREDAIQECVDRGRGDRAWCENFNRTFGNARRNANGTMRPPMFSDLPVCEEAFSARRYFSMNPSRNVYSP